MKEDRNEDGTPFPLYGCRQCGDVSHEAGICSDGHPSIERVQIPGPMADPEGSVTKALEGMRQEYDTPIEALEAQSDFFEAIVTEGLLSLLSPPDEIPHLTTEGKDAVERLLMFWVQITSFDGDGGLTWLPSAANPRGAWRAYVLERSDES